LCHDLCYEEARGQRFVGREQAVRSSGILVAGTVPVPSAFVAARRSVPTTFNGRNSCYSVRPTVQWPFEKTGETAMSSRVGDLRAAARQCFAALIAGSRRIINFVSHSPIRLNVPPKTVGAHGMCFQIPSTPLPSLLRFIVGLLQHPPYNSQAKTQVILPAVLQAILQADLPPP
jgi:hypothetical protein